MQVNQGLCYQSFLKDINFLNSISFNIHGVENILIDGLPAPHFTPDFKEILQAYSLLKGKLVNWKNQVNNDFIFDQLISKLISTVEMEESRLKCFEHKAIDLINRRINVKDAEEVILNIHIQDLISSIIDRLYPLVPLDHHAWLHEIKSQFQCEATSLTFELKERYLPFLKDFIQKIDSLLFVKFNLEDKSEMIKTLKSFRDHELDSLEKNLKQIQGYSNSYDKMISSIFIDVLNNSLNNLSLSL